jgi:hypothetical protein
VEYTVDLFLGQFEELMNKLNLFEGYNDPNKKQISLLGHSMGGNHLINFKIFIYYFG